MKINVNIENESIYLPIDELVYINYTQTGWIHEYIGILNFPVVQIILSKITKTDNYGKYIESEWKIDNRGLNIQDLKKFNATYSVESLDIAIKVVKEINIVV